MTYCNMYACLLTVMCLNMWDGCAADVPLSRGSGSVLQQLQQLQQAGRAEVPAGQLQCRRWRWSMNTVQSEDVSPQTTEPPLDQSGIHATPSTLHPSLQQPH